jgi:hypothetical protein
VDNFASNIFAACKSKNTIIFVLNNENMHSLTIEQIKTLYPEQWVLIGNPELDDTSSLGSIVSKLIKGVVLSASKDKRELALNAKELRAGYESIACIFTGTFPKKRRWLL